MYGLQEKCKNMLTRFQSPLVYESHNTQKDPTECLHETDYTVTIIYDYRISHNCIVSSGYSKNWNKYKIYFIGRRGIFYGWETRE